MHAGSNVKHIFNTESSDAVYYTDEDIVPPDVTNKSDFNSRISVEESAEREITDVISTDKRECSAVAAPDDRCCQLL